MNRKTLNWIVDAVAGAAIAGFVLGTYIAWPYWSAYQLRQAIENRDAATLSRKVEWPTLRANIKETFAAEMLQEVSSSKTSEDATEKAAIGLAAIVGPAVINGMVDAYFTPKGIVTLLKKAEKSDQGAAAWADTGLHVKRAGLVSFTRFEFEVGKPAEGNGTILAVMELTGFDWKLTNLILKEPLGSLLKTPTNDRQPRQSSIVQ